MGLWYEATFGQAFRDKPGERVSPDRGTNGPVYEGWAWNFLSRLHLACFFEVAHPQLMFLKKVVEISTIFPGDLCGLAYVATT